MVISSNIILDFIIHFVLIPIAFNLNYTHHNLMAISSYKILNFSISFILILLAFNLNYPHHNSIAISINKILDLITTLWPLVVILSRTL